MEETGQSSRELRLAHRIIEQTGANLFLTGKAGTGKTTFLHKLRKTTHKRTVVLAPTGIAAINANGQTIHSFFQFPLTPFIPGDGFVGERNYFSLNRETRRILQCLDLLIIDEVSMVRPDLLDAIDASLRHYRRSTQPFGGVQLLLIGDLRQLQPVLREEDHRLLSTYYKSPYFFDSIALQQAGFLTIELTTIFRQNDPEFIFLLNSIRDGHIDNDTLQRLNNRYQPDFHPKDDAGYIRLTTHNHRADEINREHMEALPSKPLYYKASITGNFPESAYPAQSILELKHGARVMFIRNDSSFHSYYNGLTGSVTKLLEDEVIVRVSNSDGSTRDISVSPVEWERSHYKVDDKTKEIKQEVDGKFRQLPLRPAWAITIHKSQGLTFDKAVIDAASSFAAGQAYVALSRCRTLQGVVLDSQLTPQSVITDPKVNSFLSAATHETPDEDCINRLANSFFLKTISELFDFNSLGIFFDNLHRSVDEYITPIYKEFKTPYEDISSQIHRSIIPVGNRFSTLYTSPGIDVEALCTPKFYEKIQSGCRYFLEKLQPLDALLTATSAIHLDNKRYCERVTKDLDATRRQLAMQTGILQELKDRYFSIATYQEIKAKVVIDLDKPSVRSKKHTEKVKPKKEKKPKGYSRVETLKLFKVGNSIEDIAEQRSLTISTIIRHLSDCIREEELKLNDILTDREIKVCDDACNEDSREIEWKEFQQLTCVSVTTAHAAIYWHVRNLRNNC